MAYVNLLEVVYPVGSIYLTTLDMSPAETIGGTWQQIEKIDIGPALTKTIYTGSSDSFKAYQTGNLLIYHGLGPFLTMNPWEEKKVLSSHRFPSAKYGYYGGEMVNQESGYGACVIISGDGIMHFNNKNANSLGQWYFGGGVYEVSDDEALINDLGVKMWKRIA